MSEKPINLEQIKQVISHPRIGEILIQQRKVTLEQLTEALEVRANSDTPIGRILIDKGFISEDELIELLSLQKNIDKLMEDCYSELEQLKNGHKNSPEN